MKSLTQSGTLIFQILINMYWKSVIATFNFFVCHFNLVSLKWWSSEHQRIANNSSGPDVYLIRVPYCSLYYFRSNIIRCPTHSPLFLITELKLGSESKIPDFQIHVIIEENVTHFEIAVNNTITMHVLQRRDNLQHKISCLFDGQFFSLFYHLTQCLVSAELEYNVDILGVFEDAVELDNVLMVESLVDFNFGQQLRYIRSLLSVWRDFFVMLFYLSL